MSGGLLGFGDPNADKKMADDYGVTPEMLSAQRMSSLGNIGAILLAAAQPGPIGQRGQILAGLANVSGNAAAGLKDAVAARMNGIKLKEAQQDLARKAAVRDMVSKMNLPDDQKAWAVANPDQFLAARGQSQLATQQAVNTETALQGPRLEYAKKLGEANTDQAIRQETALQGPRLEYATKLGEVQTNNAIRQEQALDPIRLKHAERMAIVQSNAPYEAKVAQLVQSGVPEDRARGLASGRYTWKDQEDIDGSKVPTLWDSATGTSVGGGGAQPRVGLNPDQAKIMPSITPRTQDGAGVAYDEGTGGMGAVKRGINTVVEGLTGSSPYPAADKAIDDLNKLNARTLGALSIEIPGRSTNQVRDMLKPVQVDPASPFMPDSRAYQRSVDTKAVVDRQISTMEQQLQQGGLTRSDRSKIRQNLDMLKGVSADWGVVIDNFGDKKPAPAVGATGTGGQGGPQFKILGVRDR